MNTTDALQDPRTRTAFLASMRYDLRAPLNAIIGYTEMLLEDCAVQDPAGLIPDLERIQTTGRRLLNMVNDLLDPVKIEADLQLDRETFANNIHYQLRNPLNIIIGYSEIALEKCAEIPHDTAVSQLQKIDAASQRLLVLIDDIIQVARFAAGVEELEDMGDEVDTLALLAEDVLSTIQTMTTQGSRLERAGEGSLLVVDDNQEGRDVLALRLAREGYEVATAVGGLEALAMLEADPDQYDLILLEAIMPIFNGYQLLEAVKKDEQLQHIPVILFSPLNDVESFLHAIEMGAHDFLPKPYNQQLLKARIDATLDRKRLRDRERAYIYHVQILTAAATAVEAGDFDPESITLLTQRTDELGRLARVFQNMVYEVQARERRLQAEVMELRIQIDRQREDDKVAAIVESDYFQELQLKAKSLKAAFRA